MPRVHRKSRTGCTQCKRRRVKCDERKPLCANCERNGLRCSLEFLTPMTNASRGMPLSSPHGQSKSRHKLSYSLETSLSQELNPSHFDPQTTEILYHYTTFLYKSLAGNREASVWAVDMPRLGLAHRFLLSGILAVSALHLSTFLPSRKRELQNYAVAQESAALPSFRYSMDNPNSDTIHAVFGFAGAVVYYVMASPEAMHAGQKVDRCRLPSREDDHPHWFQTMRGLMVVLKNNWLELAKGPFAPLLEGDPGPIYSWYNPDDEQLERLDGIFPPLSPPSCSSSSPLSRPLSPFSSSPSSPLLSREERNMEIYRDALKELRRVSALSHSPNGTLCTKTAAYTFPGSINQDFVELIYQRDERALVILAHYCVMLKRIDFFWYLNGLGAGLLENIWQALGEEWRPWIQWAIDQPVALRI